MAEERYVDPNSGAAPQPGGFAGPHAVEVGHGSPNNEVVVPGVSQDASMGLPAEEDEQQAAADKALETQAVDLSDSGESDSGDDYSELLSGTVDEVNAYLDANPDKRDAVVEAEKNGANRKGIVGG